MTDVPIFGASREGHVLAEDFSDAAADAVMVVPDNDGNVLLEARYTGGSTATLTIISTLVVASQTLENTVVAFDTTDTEKLIGPIPPALFNQLDGSVLINCTADLLVRGFRI